jgi:CRP-like cAMP-binding protein
MTHDRARAFTVLSVRTKTGGQGLPVIDDGGRVAMESRQGAGRPTGNRLLDNLSDASWEVMAPALQLVQLARKDSVGGRGEVAEHAIFPCGAVLSVLAYMEDGAAVEVATVGREGLFGIELLLGGKHWTETTVCQIEGAALRIGASAFLEAIDSEPTVLELARRYAMAYLSVVSQSVACNRLHNIEERFARWILMTHDRVASDSFNLTQEFIADMLGVHRPSVSLVAGSFQKAGFIKYARGTMTILNREGLEQASCECYGATQQAYARLGLP